MVSLWTETQTEVGRRIGELVQNQNRYLHLTVDCWKRTSLQGNWLCIIIHTASIDWEPISYMLGLGNSPTKKASDHVHILDEGLNALHVPSYSVRYMTAENATDMCTAARLMKEIQIIR